MCSPEVNIRCFSLSLSTFLRNKNDHIHSLPVTHTSGWRELECRWILCFKLAGPRDQTWVCSPWVAGAPLLHFTSPPSCFKDSFSHWTWTSLIGYTVWPVNTQDPPICLPSSGITGMCCQAGFFTVGSEEPNLHLHACISLILLPVSQLPRPLYYNQFCFTCASVWLSSSGSSVTVWPLTALKIGEEHTVVRACQDQILRAHHTDQLLAFSIY